MRPNWWLAAVRGGAAGTGRGTRAGADGLRLAQALAALGDGCKLRHAAAIAGVQVPEAISLVAALGRLERARTGVAMRRAPLRTHGRALLAGPCYAAILRNAYQAALKHISFPAFDTKGDNVPRPSRNLATLQPRSSISPEAFTPAEVNDMRTYKAGKLPLTAARRLFRVLASTSILAATVGVVGTVALPSVAHADSCSDQAASNYNACTTRGLAVCAAAGIGLGPWVGAACSVAYRQQCLDGQQEDLSGCDTGLDPNNSNVPYPVEDWSNISEGAPAAPLGDYGDPTEGSSGVGSGVGDFQPGTEERNV